MADVGLKWTRCCVWLDSTSPYEPGNEIEIRVAARITATATARQADLPDEENFAVRAAFLAAQR